MDAKKLTKEKSQKITMAIAAGIILVLVLGIVLLVKSLNFSDIIFSFGKGLKTDANGHTNILLAGIGGVGHDGADLTDTIMMASIDYDHKIITLLSIPRDLYIKDQNFGGVDLGGGKINSVYEEGIAQAGNDAGMKDLESVVGGITNTDFQYYAVLDFSGFTKLVDSLGGVDVVVQKDLYDPYYPLGETTQYQTFSISAGPHHLDGATALKYARSRETTTDFDRARRQQQIIAAIKDKALSLNILTDPGKIQDLYNSIQGSIVTDMSVDEMIGFAKTVKDFSNQNIVSHVISDSPMSCGGYLYSPASAYFGGAYVLLPAGKTYDSIHEMTDLIFNHPDVMMQQTPVAILNGTKVNGLANGVESYLSRLCFNVASTGNADNKNHTATMIYYQPDAQGQKPAAVDLIAKYLPYPEVAGIPPQLQNLPSAAGASIVIVLGSDYASHRLDDPFAVTPYAIAPASVTQQNTLPTTQQVSH